MLASRRDHRHSLASLGFRTFLSIAALRSIVPSLSRDIREPYLLQGHRGSKTLVQKYDLIVSDMMLVEYGNFEYRLMLCRGVHFQVLRVAEPLRYMYNFTNLFFNTYCCYLFSRR